MSGGKMKIRINKGTIGRRGSIPLGGEGFNMLFAGEYGAELLGVNQMIIYKANGEKSYLSMNKLEEKILRGDITILNS